MPSRINIGPEDGPYVAINESSGNLQLEDNSGNVVAEWDETNAQWDFANNTLANVDALDSNSVNTEQASIDQLTTDHLIDVRDFDNNLQNAVDSLDQGQAVKLHDGFVASQETISWTGSYRGIIGPQEAIGRVDTGTLDRSTIILDGGRGQFVKGLAQGFNQSDGDPSEIIIDNQSCVVEYIYGRNIDITVKDNENFISNCHRMSITFESGTSQNVADTIVRGTITDNGDNIIGDVS